MPNGLLIDGGVYPIDTDFRTAITYQALAAQGTLTAECFYRLWFPAERPEALEEAMEAVGQFYSLGQRTKPETVERKAIPYDFHADASVIFAAFQRHYGIDLNQASLHWWQFRVLLEGLVTHSFRQRVAYRMGELQGLSAGERAEVLKFRQLYRIGSEPESLTDHLLRLEQAAQRQKRKEGEA